MSFDQSNTFVKVKVDQKNIFVTGTSSGIGFELVKEFVKQGHKVFAVSRNIEPLEDLIVKTGSKNIVPLKLDLTQDDYTIIYDKLGFSKIHVVINNAGYLVNKLISNQTLEDFRLQYEVNVIAVFKLVKYLLSSNILLENSSTICNITSMGGVMGSSKFAGLSGYSSSKGAVTILTECLAEELSPYGISVNALALGAVQTEMLQKAFPDYQAQISSHQMAQYICDFVLNRSVLFNGKIIPVANSTP